MGKRVTNAQMRNSSFSFTVTPQADGTNTWPDSCITHQLLYDIREELKELNAIMKCHNTRQIPYTIKRIDARLQKFMPLRPRKTKA